VSALRNDITTSWDAPRQRPTAYALVALFMLLLANLFPFIYMKVGGSAAKSSCWKFPNVLFSEDYASLGTFFLLFVQLVPAFAWSPFCCWSIGSDARGLKAFLARILFHLKTWGWRRSFSPGCW
jgi:paraquat-inducible protein A